MPYPVLIITDHGSSQRVAEMFALAGQAAISMEAPIAEITADLFRIEEAQFSSQGRRGGGSWKQLADSTVRRKGSSKILRDTDELYHSLTELDAPGQILEVSGSGIVFGTDRPWAAVHQHGSANAHIPARPFLRILPGDVNRWTQIILRHLERAFKDINARF